MRPARAIPKALSLGEETLAAQLRAYHIQFEREVRFHPTRKWRFDFVLTGTKIAVEVEGGGRNGKAGRHQTRKGFAGDCEKYNAAIALGWQVLRFPAVDVMKGVAVDQIREILAYGTPLRDIKTVDK